MELALEPNFAGKKGNNLENNYLIAGVKRASQWSRLEQNLAEVQNRSLQTGIVNLCVEPVQVLTQFGLVFFCMFLSSLY